MIVCGAIIVVCYTAILIAVTVLMVRLMFFEDI
jgi:hypothetical protein